MQEKKGEKEGYCKQRTQNKYIENRKKESQSEGKVSTYPDWDSRQLLNFQEDSA